MGFSFLGQIPYECPQPQLKNTDADKVHAGSKTDVNLET